MFPVSVMNFPEFDITDEPDYLYRAYRDTVLENDSLRIEPIVAGKNILILPIDAPRCENDGRLVLYLDSSHAFGDGRHPTTILCLSLLEEYLDPLAPDMKKKISMLDMGTGTGVLSILAARMGVENILAVDIDPEAIRSAADQAGRNGCVSIDFCVMDASLLPSGSAYGLITANLLPPILRSVLPLAARLSLPGTPVIVSGIGDSSSGDMEVLMKDSGFTVVTHRTSGWWHAYLIRR